MKKHIFLGLILVLQFYSQSQINKDGVPFIVEYTDEDFGNSGQIWSITQDTRGVMYFGCNFGLKTYDGKNWKSYNIPHSTIIRSLATDDNGMVYYGAESDFGAIIADDKGDKTFYSFYLNKFENEKQDFGSVWKTLIADNKVYFQSFDKIFYCDLPIKIDENNKLVNDIKILKPEKTEFHLSFSVNDKLYIREWDKGLCVLNGDKAELIPGGELFALSRVYIMLPFDKTKILIGTRQMGFYIYDTQKKENAIVPFLLEEEDLIKNSSLYSGINLPDDNIAINTFNDGIIVINKKGQIVKHLNINTGLPNNYILSVYNNSKTKDQNLWFASDKGIFNANISGPFTVWNEHTGISGTAYSALRFQGVLYVSTSEGLFYLDESSEKKPIFKLIQNELDCWKLYIYTIPNSNEKKLLMGSFSGVSEVENFKTKLIAEIQNAVELYQSKSNPQNLYIGCDGGLFMLKYENNKWSDLIGREKGDIPQVKSINEFEAYLALGSGSSGVYLLKDIQSENIIVIDSAKGLPLIGQDFYIHKIKDKTVIAGGAGLYLLNDTNSVQEFDLFGKLYTGNNKGVNNFMEDDDSYWLSVYETADDANFQLIRLIGKDGLRKDSVFSKRISQKPAYFLFQDGNYVWISNEKGLFKFNKLIQKDYKSPFETLITKVTTSGDSLLFAGNYMSRKEGFLQLTNSQDANLIPILKFKNNRLNFEWAAPFFEKEEETEYSYRLLGETDQWSKWDKRSETRFTNLFEGDYTFEVKSRNIYFTESSVARYSFSILPPWHRTIWAYVSYLIVGVFLVILIIKLYTKKLKRENEKLEQIVKERTVEIRMQNEEITAQRDEIQVQKEHVEKAKDKIEKQQKSILDSIHYANRIQEAVLPPDDYLQEILGQHFVLFKPRDIVSGDFYWATQRGNKTVIVAADCTGHGVPGAFMSMLGISFLNEIVNKEEVLQANIILNRLRENVKKSLRQTGKDNEAKDGMDVAICIIDMDEMTLQFAGAYNPLFIIRNGEFSKVNADRMPIGIYLREKESFTNNIIDIKKGDYLYIFSDGYIDQFGGPTDDKIKSEKFKSILLENYQKSPEEQERALVNHLETWMAFTDNTGRTYKQVDDILVIGIEI